MDAKPKSNLSTLLTNVNTRRIGHTIAAAAHGAAATTSGLLALAREIPGNTNLLWIIAATAAAGAINNAYAAMTAGNWQKDDE